MHNWKRACPNGHGEQEGNYCSVCGEELPTPPRNQGGWPFEVGGEMGCPGCYYPLKHNHQQFCPGCSHELTWSCR